MTQPAGNSNLEFLDRQLATLQARITALQNPESPEYTALLNREIANGRSAHRAANNGQEPGGDAGQRIIQEAREAITGEIALANTSFQQTLVLREAAARGGREADAAGGRGQNLTPVRRDPNDPNSPIVGNIDAAGNYHALPSARTAEMEQATIDATRNRIGVENATLALRALEEQHRNQIAGGELDAAKAKLEWDKEATHLQIAQRQAEQADKRLSELTQAAQALYSGQVSQRGQDIQQEGQRYAAEAGQRNVDLQSALSLGTEASRAQRDILPLLAPPGFNDAFNAALRKIGVPVPGGGYNMVNQVPGNPMDIARQTVADILGTSYQNPLSQQVSAPSHIPQVADPSTGYYAPPPTPYAPPSEPEYFAPSEDGGPSEEEAEQLAWQIANMAVMG